MDSGQRTERARIDGSTDGEDTPYEGTGGATRLESIHVTIPGGHVRSVKVYTGVNVSTDPELREAALRGALHRFEGGEELALPFVFHDPEGRRFALVLPEALRHRELAERSGLLATLAEDREHAIPSYVREAVVVIGLDELRAYLDRPADRGVNAQRSDLERREQALLEAIEQLAQREQRLKHRAEDITRREDEMRTTLEMVEAHQRDLAVREEELEARFELVQQREVGVASQRPSAAAGAGAGPAIGAEAKPTSRAPADSPAAASTTSEQDPMRQSTDALSVDEDEIEEIDDLSAVTTDAAIAGVVPVAAADAMPDITDESVEELVDDDDVEELDVSQTSVALLAGNPASPKAREESGSPLSASRDAAGKPTAGAAPRELMEVPDAEMVPVLDEEGLTLYARTEPSRPDMFRAGDADLLIQLVVVEERPVVLLALTELTPGRPAVRRAALDPRGATERNVLEALRSSFHARVRLFAPDGRLVRAFEVRASRRVNTALVIERAQRLSGGDIDAVTAMERAFAAPPPVRDASHPFQTEEPPPARNAREALASLELLAEWSQPERLERALLALSVPKDVVDGSMRQILADAVRFGLALPPSLATRAVSVGVGADAAEIVARQLDAFRLTVERGDRGGLSVEQVAQNWEALIEAAGRHELSLDEKSHALARDAMRAVHGDRPSLPDNIDLAKLPTLDIPGLVMLLDHPKVRRDAALELAKRSEPQLLETLMKAVRKMPREEVVRVVPRLVDHGEAAGDAFIDALAARKTFVRQAAALGLGELKLRRAVVPVLHLLLSEQSEIWPELARTLGGFGTGAVRALTRALKDPKGQEARLSLALAHLALHGCEKQVEDLANGRDKKIAVIALEGLNLRPDARNSLGKVRGDRPLEPSDGVLQFSKRFMEEREGRAPEGDLTHD